MRCSIFVNKKWRLLSYFLIFEKGKFKGKFDVETTKFFKIKKYFGILYFYNSLKTRKNDKHTPIVLVIIFGYIAQRIQYLKVMSKFIFRLILGSNSNRLTYLFTVSFSFYFGSSHKV
jgi:hypothetical protein